MSEIGDVTVSMVHSFLFLKQAFSVEYLYLWRELFAIRVVSWIQTIRGHH